MDWHCIYVELKSWQSAIGSLLGFIALMVGALWNFHLGRKRDAALRAEETLSVEAALYGEIVLLREEAAHLLERVFDRVRARDPDYYVDEAFLAMHPTSEPIFYKALASKVGLLRSDLVLSITAFYNDIQTMRTALPLLVPNEERGFEYSSLEAMVPAYAAVVKILPALRAIERSAKIESPARDFDLEEIRRHISAERSLYGNAL